MICVIQAVLYYYNINIYEVFFEYFYGTRNIKTNDNINLEESIKDLTHVLEELKET